MRWGWHDRAGLLPGNAINEQPIRGPLRGGAFTHTPPWRGGEKEGRSTLSSSVQVVTEADRVDIRLIHVHAAATSLGDDVVKVSASKRRQLVGDTEQWQCIYSTHVSYSACSPFPQYAPAREELGPRWATDRGVDKPVNKGVCKTLKV